MAGNSLRIGMDAREAFRQNPRGIGLYARHLIREYTELCPEHEFLLYHERDRPSDMPPIPANMHPRRAVIRGGRVHAWERVLMPWRLRRDGLSVYHGTYNTLPPRWPLWRGPPMVVTLHDLIVTWYPEGLDDPYVQYCRSTTRRIVRQAAAILTVSEWSKRDIVDRHGVDPAKIRVFYNGVHPLFLAGAGDGAGDRARARFAGGRRYLFSIGSPLPRKNTAAMIEALGRLRQRRGLDHVLLISGLGEHRAGFEAVAARCGMGDATLYLPYVPLHDLVDIYAGADLTIYPSKVEGWGIPVIESLALGTPVATSETSGMREAGGEHATFFDPEQIESMVDGLARALDGLRGFAAIRSAAIARARAFTWRRAAEITLETYRAVAAAS